MTQEEKARAYDEALKRARNLHKDAIDMGENVQAKQCEIIFPEIKESDDEKIRKEIISALKYANHKGVYDKHLALLEKQCTQETLCDKCRKAQPSHSCQDITELGRCYLEHEKQSEQKVSVADFKAKDWYVSKVDGKIHNIHHSVDKVEPKFKVGDFIVNDYCMGKVIELTDDAYLLDTEQGIPFSCEHNAHLWTIEDAKDGDVLAVEHIGRYKFPFIAIYKNYGLNFFNSYCSIGFDGKFYEADTEHVLDDIHLATKEQRDLLFQKIKENGYEWDAEKKELKKIHVIDEGKDEMDYCFTKMMNGEKVKPQSSTPMSYGKELEAKMHEACDRFFAPNTDPNRYSAADLFYAGVKAERGLNTHAWSEEDECYMSECIGAIATKDGWSFEEKRKTKHWLESLKQRNTWKPSDEQMNLLSDLVEDNNQRYFYTTLNSLYEQLKKLREE